MPTEKIQKANEISSLINGWGKILVAVGSLIGGCFFFYYQVQSNEAEIKSINVKIKDLEEANSREFKIWSDRSDKRHSRAMHLGETLLEDNMKQDDRLNNLDRRLSYLEGVVDSEDN
jgi:hypothetical protein